MRVRVPCKSRASACAWNESYIKYIHIFTLLYILLVTYYKLTNYLRERKCEFSVNEAFLPIFSFTLFAKMFIIN